MKAKKFLLCILIITTLFMTFFSCKSSNSGTRYNRSETLYCGGGLWNSPNNWNPITPWAATPGTLDLIYETLFIWDPITTTMTPWLAEEGKWTNNNNYILKIRKNIKWTDGEPLNAKDVKYTLELSKQYKAIYYNNIWKWIEKIELIDDYTLNFKFINPHYHEWENNLYQISIIPEHIWSKKTQDEILLGANQNPIGTGAYLFETFDQDRMIYLKNQNWWAINDLKIEPAPKRIVYLKILSNSIALNMVMKGDLDISNFYIPGVPLMKKRGKLQTWFDNEPYMLSHDTAILFVNTSKKPLDDVKFRRAISFSLNVDQIIKNVFENMVLPSNSLGFLPITAWMNYYNEDIVKKYGFKYSPDEAKRILKEAGYVDKDADGFIESKDGSKIKIEIIVPSGWTDWMESIRVIAKNLQDIGINAEAKFPDYGKYWNDLTMANYDLAINNFNSSVSNTPWTLLNWLFQKVTKGEPASTGNFERYDNPTLNSLIEKFNATPISNLEEAKNIMADISRINLQEMPVIPLWFNGMWFQASNKHWVNWPNEHNSYAYPITTGHWGVGGLKMLTQLKAKK